jgi:hypothetical protein
MAASTKRELLIVADHGKHRLLLRVTGGQLLLLTVRLFAALLPLLLRIAAISGACIMPFVRLWNHPVGNCFLLLQVQVQPGALHKQLWSMFAGGLWS